MLTTSILAIIGVSISFYKVLVTPKDYFLGLFKEVSDKDKTDSLYILIVLITLISAPAYFIFNIPLESLDIVAALLFSLAFLWKAYEIFKSPKLYFKGLFKNGESKTSFEPIAMLLISMLVNYAYFTKII